MPAPSSPTTSRRPSGLKPRAETFFGSGASRVASSRPDSASTSCTRLRVLVIANAPPTGLKAARPGTPAAWFLRACKRRDHELRSHMAYSCPDAVTSHRPSGLKSTSALPSTATSRARVPRRASQTFTPLPCQVPVATQRPSGLRSSRSRLGCPERVMGGSRPRKSTMSTRPTSPSMTTARVRPSRPRRTLPVERPARAPNGSGGPTRRSPVAERPTGQRSRPVAPLVIRKDPSGAAAIPAVPGRPMKAAAAPPGTCRRTPVSPAEASTPVPAK